MHLAAFAAAMCTVHLAACSSADPSDLPEPPEGADLVIEIGELQVYDVTDASLCAGTLRRIELHAKGLAELFEMEPPRARVFVYDDQSVIDEKCGYTEPVLGCAPRWGAHASANSVTHELVHVFVHAATDHTTTWPAIQEGVAFRLDGLRSEDAIFVDLEDELFGATSAFDVPQVPARHFFAWVVDDFGIDAVLAAHLATSTLADEDVALVFAQTLGFPSVAALQESYVDGHASEYPPLPDTVRVFSAEELASGIALDTSCAGPLTEGPLPLGIGLHTVARLDIPEAGQYEVSHEPIPDDDFDLRLRLDEPFAGVLFPNRPEMCAGDEGLPRYFFPTAGHYELNLDYALDESFDVTLSTHYLSSEECPQ